MALRFKGDWLLLLKCLLDGGAGAAGIRLSHPFPEWARLKVSLGKAEDMLPRRVEFADDSFRVGDGEEIDGQGEETVVFRLQLDSAGGFTQAGFVLTFVDLP